MTATLDALGPWEKAQAPAWLARRRPRLTLAGLLVPTLMVLEYSRRPSTLLDPQLSAEDGTDTYAAAYNHGLGSLVQPIAGYWQIPNRIVGLLAGQLPLRSAAILFASVGLACALLPLAILLWSRRAAILIPDGRLRLGVAVVYICVQPPELRFSATNAQWHLVIAALMVVLLPRASTRASRAADLALVAATATSGPLGLALLPPAAMSAWRHRDRRSLVILGVLIAGAAIEAAVYLIGAHAHPRHSGNPGESLSGVAPLLASRVFLAFAGRTGNVPGGEAGALIVCAVSLGMVGAAVWRGPALLRWMLLLGTFALAVGVTHPYYAFEESRSAWYAMLHQEGYQRYFFLADLAWMGTLLWLASRLRGRHRVPACVGIVLISVLMASRMWVDPTPAPTDLAAQQVRLDSAPSGSVVTIPITPDRWEMLLTRH